MRAAAGSVCFLRGYPLARLLRHVRPVRRRQKQPADSGTPTLAWDSAIESNLVAMRSAFLADDGSRNDRDYTQIKAKADAALATNNEYDVMAWAAWMYRSGAGTSYATKAITALKYALQNGQIPDWSDASREHLIPAMVVYDWCYDQMSAADRTTIYALFETRLDAEIAHYSIADSDQVIGALVAGATLLSRLKDENGVRSSAYANHATVGGFTSTLNPSDETTRRSTGRNFVDDCNNYLSAGGHREDGPHYGAGTGALVLKNAYHLFTATTPTQHFPTEYSEQFAKDLIRAFLVMLTPDLSQWVTWGDLQDNPRTALPRLIVGIVGLAAARLGDTTESRWAWKYREEMITERGISAIMDFATNGLAPFWMPHVNGTQADWRSSLYSHWSAGQGVAVARSGWNALDSISFLHARPRWQPVHHDSEALGNFQIWRKGEYAVTHPLGYGNASSGLANHRAPAHNMMLFSGIGVMANGLGAQAGTRAVVAQEFDSATPPKYSYLAGTTYGKQRSDGAYSGQVAYLQEHTRFLFHLFSSDRSSDVLVVFDRCFSDNGLTANGGSANVNARYDAYEADRIINSPNEKEWVVHCPVNPDVATANQIKYTTSGGQLVRVTTFLPSSNARTVYNEATAGTVATLNTANFNDGVPPEEGDEIHYAVWVHATSHQNAEPFLHAVVVYDTTHPTLTQVSSSAGEAGTGLLVQRASHGDALVLFSNRGTAGQRLFESGMTFGWTAAVSPTTVYLCGLDTTKTWTYTVDGGGSQSLTESANGVGIISVSGTGAHTIVLTGV